MRDDDRLLELPDAEFGSGVVGVCDICGTRQAVVVLTKERYKLCVIDFLNKTWIKSEKKPGVPAPLYRSDRVTFETKVSSTGSAQAIVLSPTKVVKHPVVLVTPDVYGLTTTVLDAAIRFAREGFEVLVPDVAKTDGIGAGHHVALRSSAQLRGGVAVGSPRVSDLIQLYSDALEYLRGRDMVDPTKSAVFGVSYGASLALALAARDLRLGAVVLAYPRPVRPPDLAKLVTAPLLLVTASSDRAAVRARGQIAAVAPGGKTSLEFLDLPNVRHGFLARDLPAYEVGPAELAWTRMIAFLKRTLMPPPPRPPAPPVKPAATSPTAKATSPTAPPTPSGSPPANPSPPGAPASPGTLSSG